MNKHIIDTILSEWSIRSENGLVSDITNEENIQSLYEVCLNTGLSEIHSLNLVNEMVLILEKGKHPERQAYNKNGLLVTFPTPEYKQRAIQKGTHFEINPKSQQSNLFGGGQQAPSQPSPDQNNIGMSPMDAGQSELPRSDSQQPQPPPAQKEVPAPGTPGTPAEPPPAPSAASAPAVQTPAQGQLAVEPTPQTSNPSVVSSPAVPASPPIPKKTPEQVEAEKQIIKQMMDTQDVLPTVAGVGGVGITEQLQKLTKVALEMNLTEAAKFLSKYI